MRKSKLILVQAIILIVLISTSVYATLNTTIILTQSSNNVSRGNKVTVKLSLKDVETTKKVTSVSGYINYNKDILDEITVDNIQKSYNGKVTIGTEELTVEDLTNATINNMPTSDAYVGFNGNPTSDNDVRLVIDFKDGVTSNVDLLTIDFYVLDDATLGEVKNAISYSMFVVSSASEQSEEITRNIDLTVVEASSENTSNTNSGNENNNTSNNNQNNNQNNNTQNNSNQNNQNNNKTNTNTNTNSNTNKTNTSTNTNTNTKSNTNTNTGSTTGSNKSGNGTDNTLSNNKLPSTGSKIIILPIVVLIVLAYISYRKYKKYKDI